MYARAFILFCLQIYISEGTICYSCSGYDHPRDCAHVTKCGVNQVCYVETNITHNGLPVYDSGCIDQTACPAILHPDVSDIIVGKRAGPFCKLCCDKDYCNDELCDLHKDNTLGPRCLSCTGIMVQDLSKCVTITQCARDEICYTERIGDSFRAGCVLEKDCKLTRSPVNAVGKRAPVTSCAQCCDKSYCNAHLCGLGNNIDITCTDNATFDCADVARSFNICSELSSAREKCRKFCGFCKYVNGQWTNWSSWTQCSRTCNNGTRQRTRSCTNPTPMNGGNPCIGDTIEHEACGQRNCPVNGQWTSWSSWTQCSRTCNNGTRQRTRSCANPTPINGGNPCVGDNIEYQACGQRNCPVNGQWINWSSWTQCSRTCNNGTRQRTRSCTNPTPSNGGNPCVGDKIEYEACGQTNCPVNGGWSEYGSWTSCTTSTCFNIGSQSRTRSCNHPSPAFGGRSCSGSVTETRTCIGYGSDCSSKIRLTGGNHGRLEVMLHKQWGTVCDDSFDSNTFGAQAVCRTLGLPYANAVVTDEDGSGTIFLDDVVCQQGGVFPRDCSFSLTHNCDHDEDVGVTCR